MPHKDLQKSKAYQAQYKRDHPEIYRLAQAKHTACGKKRATYIFRMFHVTADEYAAMERSQKGCCAICGRKQTEIKGRAKLLAIDHDKECCSGQKSCGSCVRGLLCSACNTALGLFQDDVGVLNSAVRYLFTAVQIRLDKQPEQE
jgi:hypothetical protein